MKGIHMIKRILIINILICISFACAEDVKFTQHPKAVKNGNSYTITFAVSKPTDVEVAILNEQGEIVRHLAAGKLGPKAPAPLKQGSLFQSLTFDYKDDFGAKLAPGLKYRGIVSLGMNPAFDKILGGDPNTLGVIRGLAVNPEGELFVLNLGHHMHVDFGSSICNVFDAQGIYKRTIMPYPNTVFPDKVKEFNALDLGKNGTHPWLHYSHMKSFYPFAAEPTHQKPIVTPDGRFIFANRVRGKGMRLIAVNAKDGSVPQTGPFGPAFGNEMTGFACLAIAPDSKTMYVSGASSQKRWKPIVWKHTVYKAQWKDETITPFIGNPDQADKGDAGLNEPQGVAVDKDGNIYVADRGNNRVAVFSKGGKFLHELPVESPYMVGVHKKTGAVYVLAGGDPPNKIYKFKNRKETSSVYIYDIPNLLRSLKGKKRLKAYPVFALDDTGKDPVLWVGSTTAYDRFRLFRFVEKEGKLDKPEEKGKGPGFRSCRIIQADKKKDILYIRLDGDSGVGERYRRFLKINGEDGKGKTIKFLCGTYGKKTAKLFTFGYDGHVYVVNNGKEIHKYDRDLNPVNFTGSDTNVSEPIPGHRYSLHLMGRGIAADKNGNIYVLHENVPQVHQKYGISVWGPDGKIKKLNLVSSLSQGALSLRIDPAGNLYVGDPVKPAAQVIPPLFKGKVDDKKKKPGIADNHYPIMYGSILKFAPTGGAGVGPDVDGRKGILAYDAQVGIKDDLWQYFGVGPIPGHKGGTYKHYVFTGCSCEGMRFDVDGFGRVFSPDSGRFRVLVLDTNANEITSFGEYGNQDSAGAGSTIPEPKIPFAWPSVVGVSDKAIYVSDLLNRRVVRLTYNYTVSKECSLGL
jgi:DNA-binding beta-propeller fold protein YncE